MFHARLNTVIALTALAVAVLGSTSVGRAAGKLIVPRGSVGAVQLKKNAVTGAKVKDGTLRAADFAPAQLPAGPAGPKGDRGPQGAKGDKGDPGVSGYQLVHWTSDAVDPGDQAHVEVACPNGTKALGGGLSSGQPVALTISAPSPDGTAWYVNFENLGGVPTAVAAYAVCASVH